MEDNKEVKGLPLNINHSLILICIFSLIGILFGNFFNTDIINGDRDVLGESLINRFESEISDSLYSKNSDYYGYNGFDGYNILNFYVKSYKASNYVFTEEYKNIYPKNIIAVNDRNEKKYFDNENSARQFVASSNGNYSLNIDKTEEPVYKVSYLTNTNDSTEFDPQNLSSKNLEKIENGFVIFGEYKDGKHKILDTKVIGENENINNYIDNFNRAINMAYSNIDERGSGIKSLSFAYIFDADSKGFDNIEKEVYSQENIAGFVVGVLTTILLVTVVGVLTKFEKIKDMTLYKNLSRFPIEIVAALVGLWIMPIYLLEVLYKKSQGYMLVQSMTFILIFTISFAGFYVIYASKSLYYEKSKSFVVKNSLIVAFFNWIKNVIIKKTNTVNPTDRIHVLIAYVFFLFIGFVACITVVHSGINIIVFALWVILVSLVFRYFKGLYMDLQSFEDITHEIANGNYDVKIDEENTALKNIATDINSIGSNLNKAVEKAVKSERLKSELITNVSHDLKTPLTSVINYSELLINENISDEEKKEYSKIINEKSHKLKVLIEDLFEVSKVTSQNVELHFETIDFKALIEQIIGEWEDKLEEKGLKINFNSPEEQIMVELDGHKTSRILDNIFSNIYKYALENTRVYINLKRDDDIELIIKNISKYELNISSSELLERFTRGDESRKTEGSGLGLSIASSLVEAQNGTFEIDIDGDLFKTKITF